MTDREKQLSDENQRLRKQLDDMNMFFEAHREKEKKSGIVFGDSCLENGDLSVIFADVSDLKQSRDANEELLDNARLAALNIMEDEIAAKNALARTNRKLIEQIRERKKVMADLRLSQANLLEAQKLAHLGNWSYDLIERVVTWSEEVPKVIGIDSNTPIADFNTIKDLIDPDDWARISKAATDAVTHQVMTNLEVSFHKPNNEVCVVIIICTPERDETGKTIRLNGIIQDVTERKQSEIELIKVNRLYKVISQVNQMFVHNQARETIFTEVCNIVIEHGKFRMAWIGLLDENKETIIPVTWAGVEMDYLKIIKSITTKKTPEGNGPTGRAIREGKYYYCNDIATDPNMEIWREHALKRNYLSSIALPIKFQNNVIGAFTIYASEKHFFNQTEIDLLTQVTSDISFALDVAEIEKKRLAAEKALRKMNTELEQRVKARTVQLEHTYNELEAFTYSVSHDLRAPLRNVNGWSRVLYDECTESLGENGRKYLDRVLMETDRMGNLINDLLKLSRVTLGDKKRDTIDLSAIAQHIVTRLNDKPGENKTEFIIQPEVVTMGDPHLLEIALTNLLDNAYKFSGKQPNARIEFGTSISENTKTYWVRDNGVGFDMDNAKNIFGAFQRFHNQNEFPGTGIGLATVQRIIHRHNGNIWVKSKKNHGTTFFFTIPEEII